MLAKLLRRVYFSQALIGSMLGWLVCARLLAVDQAWLGALPGSVALSLLLQWLVIYSSVAMSVPRGTRANRPQLAPSWRVAWAEYRVALKVYMVRQAWACSKPKPVVPDPGAPSMPTIHPVPVLLVHGYLCNHRVWDDMSQALLRAGHPVHSIDLEPLFTSIDNYAALIAQAVTDLQLATAAQQVALVGHSMGGLAIRAWIRSEGLGRVAKVITLGSPHQGTQLVKTGFTPNAAQMQWHSSWLAELEQSETPHVRACMHLALTDTDNIVFPQRAQTLAGTTVTEFKGLGHLELMLNPAVIGWVAEQLKMPPAPTN